MKDTSKQSDEELILAYQQGDKKVVAFLVKRWHVQFCKLAYWYVKDADASKDIAQESWQVILAKLITLKNPAKFKSWAISIVNRKAIDYLRTNKRIDNKHQQFYKERAHFTSISNIDREEVVKQKLLEAIQQLSIKQQVVIKLFYTQSYSLKEISKALNISVGTTKSRLFHAREKLKTILKNINYE
ncbi:MAG: RNA polymerase sigma factor [Tenacibaculum sp.]